MDGIFEPVSGWDVRECMRLLNGYIMLWVVKAVSYDIGMGTVVRASGIIDGVYLFHFVLVMEDWCGDSFLQQLGRGRHIPPDP